MEAPVTLRMSIIERLLHSGTFGLTVFAVIIAVALSCALRGSKGSDVVWLFISLIPAIVGLIYFGYALAFTVLDMLESPGVREPFWFPYVTADAGLFLTFGAGTTLMLITGNLLIYLRKKTQC